MFSSFCFFFLLFGEWSFVAVAALAVAALAVAAA